MQLRDSISLIVGLVLTAMTAFSSRCFAFEDSVFATRIADRIELVSFPSQIFSATKKFCAVLPEGYPDRSDHWPVLYFLHGRGRNERTLIDDSTTREALLKAPFVTVLPHGEDGWYLDSPVNAKHKYAKLLEETISAAEAKYRLSRRPQQRAIAGWSMGGYGAVCFAESHAGQFALVASIIGLLDFPRRGLPEGQSYEVPTKVFGEDETVWKKLNPIQSAARLRDTSVLLIAADDAFDRTMNENFRDRLRELKIEHDWIMLKGKHHFDVVKQAVPLVVERVAAKCDEGNTADSEYKERPK